MKAVGVVAEYNPFHTGHAYHLAETRRLLGENKPAVCVMSGSWVQRGECAVTDKWTRAAMALKGGADLVLELPLPWAISSAEHFAQGAVAILKATSVVDTISFGSESGTVEELKEVAKCLDGEGYRKALHEELNKGFSFAEARQKAMLGVLGERANILRGANDNLGVEYLRAAGEELTMMAVLRRGAGHDSDCPAEYASASYLREKLRGGEDASPWLGEEGSVMLKKSGIAQMEYIERAVLARLRQMRERDFTALPDSGSAEGLPARLCRAARQAGSLEEFYALVKTRRYAHSRIRRLALWAFLGMTEADRPLVPFYLRVLGFNDRGRDLLKEMKREAALPVLTKSAHIQALSPEARRLFELECQGTDLFGLCFDRPKVCGLDYTTSPMML